jgi:hypothetical protein
MAREVTFSDDAARPDPAKANTAAEFVDTMRRMKQWTGWGFRQLEKRATAAGQVLPRSTLTLALTRQTLPREDLVTAFAIACGCDEVQTTRWIATRRRIAAGGQPAPVSEPTPAPLRRRPLLRLSRRFAIIAAIVLVALVFGASYLIDTGHPKAANPNAAQAEPGPTPGQVEPLPPAPGTSDPSTTTTTTTRQPAAPPAKPNQAKPPGTQPTNGTPTPTPPTRTTTTTTTTTPSAPAQPKDEGRVTVQRPGAAPLDCPNPFLGTGYGPLAQCTEHSNGQARAGWYSPFTDQFDAQTDWMHIVESNWFDKPVTAADGIRAQTRGYATVNTPMGGAIWATQYRTGEARWGTFNVVTDTFYPSQGWAPADYY